MEKSIVYTCTGDAGTTSLVGGKRVKKNDIRIEAYGTVDELSAHLGLLSSHQMELLQNEIIETIQNKLFNIGAYLATEAPEGEEPKASGLNEKDLKLLENAIDVVDNELPKVKNFVLPGGSIASSRAQVARTVCRRAERRIIDLTEVAYVDPLVLKYINRLSDYLFVLARFINVSAQIEEKFWKKDW